MANSVRRARARPRVRSVSFFSLWWVVRREAAYLILHDEHSLMGDGMVRRWVASQRLTALRRLCEHRISVNPWRMTR
jgi:hypothetical protein